MSDRATDGIDYEEVAQKLLDLESTSRAEGWDDSEAIDLVRQLNKEHGPFDLEENYGQKSQWWECSKDADIVQERSDK